MTFSCNRCTRTSAWSPSWPKSLERNLRAHLRVNKTVKNYFRGQNDDINFCEKTVTLYFVFVITRMMVPTSHVCGTVRLSAVWLQRAGALYRGISKVGKDHIVNSPFVVSLTKPISAVGLYWHPHELVFTCTEHYTLAFGQQLQQQTILKCQPLSTQTRPRGRARQEHRQPQSASLTSATSGTDTPEPRWTHSGSVHTTLAHVRMSARIHTWMDYTTSHKDGNS